MPDLVPFIIPDLSTGAVYVLAGVGLVVLYRASGVLNLAQGALGALCALLVLADRLGYFGGPEWVGWIAGIVVATVLALSTGAPSRRVLPTAIRSCGQWRRLAYALIVLGFCEFIWGEWPRSLRLPTDTLGFEVIGVRVTATRAIAFGLAVAVTLGMAIFLNRSRLGLSMRALANDREISALVGVPVLRVDAGRGAISGVLSGVSGIFLANMVRLQAIPAHLHGLFLRWPPPFLGRLTSLLAVDRRRPCHRRARGGAQRLFPAFQPCVPPLPSFSPLARCSWYQRGGAHAPAASISFGRSRRASRRCASLWKKQLRFGLLLAVVVAIAIPAVASSYWLKASHVGDHRRALQPQRRAPLCATRHGLALPVRAGRRRRLGCLRSGTPPTCPSRFRFLRRPASAAALRLVFGLPALRMRGLYLALVTLMIAGGFQVVITAIDFPDGGTGFLGKVYDGAAQLMARPALRRPERPISAIASSRSCSAICIALWHERPGRRAWAMIRRSEACALSAGVNIVAYKVWAFALAGFLAGICGGLIAGLVGRDRPPLFPGERVDPSLPSR